jgi:desulfoferrodoxin (superoxide reductase-like protein)
MAKVKAMKNTSVIFVMISIMSIFLYRCGDMNENEKIKVPRFHTASDEGLWVDKAPTHVPVITFTDRDEIDVRVPMKPTKTPFHYIEAIVLMDGDKEVEAKHLTFSFDEPYAHFKLPDIEKGNYKVVVKCNTHDMWMTQVAIPSRMGKNK